MSAVLHKKVSYLIAQNLCKIKEAMSAVGLIFSAQLVIPIILEFCTLGCHFRLVVSQMVLSILSMLEPWCLSMPSIRQWSLSRPVLFTKMPSRLHQLWCPAKGPPGLV